MTGLVSQGAIAEVQYLQQRIMQELHQRLQKMKPLREVQAGPIKASSRSTELADLERQLVETKKLLEYELPVSSGEGLS